MTTTPDDGPRGGGDPGAGAREILALAVAARAGDRSATEELARRIEGPLLAWVRTRTGFGPHEARDVSQQVWVDVLRDLGKHPREGGFDPERGAFFQFVIGRFARFRVRQGLSFARCARAVRSLGGEEGREMEAPDRKAPDPAEAADLRESLPRRAAAFTELFRYVFSCGGYPHQQLSFALAKLCFGRESPRGIEGSADLVHERFGSTELSTVLDEFWDAYRAELTEASPGLLAGLAESLSPVRIRLGLSVGELLLDDPASLSLCPAELRRRPAKRTRLSDYYSAHSRGHRSAISDWCYKVERRVRTLAAGDVRACARCKLRRLPPCAPGTAIR